MQRRLVQAVSAPAGIEHLEDRDVLDRLASARGELLGGQPAGAPMALISQLGDRLTGILACVVLIDLPLVARPRAARGVARCPPPAGRRVRVPGHAGSRQRGASRCAGAGTCSGSPGSPPPPRRCGCSASGTGSADRHREEWLEGMRAGVGGAPATDRSGRGSPVRVVLVAYALAAGMLGLDGRPPRDLAADAGDDAADAAQRACRRGRSRYADISLEQLLAALPDLDALTAARLGSGLRAPCTRAAGCTPAAGAVLLPPRARVSLRAPRLHLPGRGRAGPARPRARAARSASSLGLVGVNGAGKTTLVTLLARMREPTGGADHRRRPSRWHELNAREWQQQVAVVYQDFAALAAERRRERRACSAMARRTRACWRARRTAPGAAEIIDQLPAWLGHRPLAALRGWRRPIRRAVAADRAGAGACTRSAVAPACSCSTSRPHSSTSAARPRSTTASSS